MFSAQVDNSEEIAQAAIAEALVLIKKSNKDKKNRLTTSDQLAILKQDYLDLSQKLYDIYTENPLLSIKTKKEITKMLFELAESHVPLFANKAFSSHVKNFRLPEVLALSYPEIFRYRHASVSIFADSEAPETEEHILKGRRLDLDEVGPFFLFLSLAMELNDTQFQAYFAGVKVWPNEIISFDQLFHISKKFIPERWNAAIGALSQLDLSAVTILNLGMNDLNGLNEEQWNSWIVGLKNIISHLKNIQYVDIATESIIKLSLSRRAAFLSLFKDVPFLLLDMNFSDMTKETLERQDKLCLKEDKEGMLTLKGKRLSCDSKSLEVLLDPINEISHLCLNYQDYQLEFWEWKNFLALVSQSCVIDLQLEGNSYQIPPAVKEKLNECYINNHFKWVFPKNADGSVTITDMINQLNLDELSTKMALNPYHPAEGLKYCRIDFSSMHIVGRENDVDNSPFNEEKIEKVFNLLSRLMLSNVNSIDFSEEMLRDLNDDEWKYFIEQLSLLLLKLPSLKGISLRNADGADIHVTPARIISLITAFSQTENCIFRINPKLFKPFSKEQVESLSICLQEASASILINQSLINTVHAEFTNINPDAGKILSPIFEKLKAFKIPIPTTCAVLDTEIEPFFSMIKVGIFSFLVIKELKIKWEEREWLDEKVLLEALYEGLKQSGIHTLSINNGAFTSLSYDENIKKILLKNAQTHAFAHVNLKTGILFSIWSRVTDKKVDENKKEALLLKLKEYSAELEEQYHHLPYSHMKM